MKNYDAYIFDFDYTLADATEPVVGSFLYALEKMNLQKSSRQDIINTIGIPIGESYTILTGDDSEEGIELFKKYQKEKSDEITVPNTVFIGDAKEVLKILKNRGKKIGIVSSRWGQRINDIFENLNSRELIDFIIGTEHVENYKPNPEGLFKMIDMIDAKNPLWQLYRCTGSTKCQNRFCRSYNRNNFKGKTRILPTYICVRWFKRYFGNLNIIW